MDNATISVTSIPEPLLEDAYDVVVVGAGPAGSTAAQAAVSRGAKVLLIDAKRRIGIPVRCGELVSQWISRYVDLSARCVQETVHKMVTHLPDGSSFEMAGPGYMLDRSLFDRQLAAAAVRSGASLSIATRAAGPDEEGLIVSQMGRFQKIRTKVLIAADGARSTVARWLGLPPLKMITTAQYEVVQSAPQNDVDIFLHPDYQGGYGWFFPKGETANVGVGMIAEKASGISRVLESLLRRLLWMGKLSHLAVVGKTGGLVPCQARPQTVIGNVLFVGDAAGQAHPITGAGILHGVMAGQMAGRVAAEAVEAHDLNHLNHYETQWRNLFGETLLYGEKKRALLEREWKDSQHDFENLIRRTWVGFKSYYQERRGRERWQTM